jgi:hypothetical protein
MVNLKNHDMAEQDSCFSWYNAQNTPAKRPVSKQYMTSITWERLNINQIFSFSLVLYANNILQEVHILQLPQSKVELRVLTRNSDGLNTWDS